MKAKGHILFEETVPQNKVLRKHHHEKRIKKYRNLYVWLTFEEKSGL